MRTRNFKLSIYFGMIFLFMLSTVYVTLIDNHFSNSYSIANDDRYTLDRIDVYKGERISFIFTEVQGSFNLTVSLASIVIFYQDILGDTRINLDIYKDGRLTSAIGASGSVYFSLEIEISGFSDHYIISLYFALFSFFIIWIVEFLFWIHLYYLENKIDRDKTHSNKTRMQFIWTFRSYSRDFLNKQHILLFIVPMILFYLISGESINVVDRFRINHAPVASYSFPHFAWNLASELLNKTIFFAAFMLPLLHFREFNFHQSKNLDHDMTYPYRFKLAFLVKIWNSYILIFGFVVLQVVRSILISGEELELFNLFVIFVSMLLTSLSLLIIICLFYIFWEIFESLGISLVLFPLTMISILGSGPSTSTSITSVIGMKYFDSQPDTTPNIIGLTIFRIFMLFGFLIVLLYISKIRAWLSTIPKMIDRV